MLCLTACLLVCGTALQLEGPWHDFSMPWILQDAIPKSWKAPQQWPRGHTPCTLGSTTSECTQRGNKRVNIWIESQWGLEKVLGATTCANFLAYHHYIADLRNKVPLLWNQTGAPTTCLGNLTAHLTGEADPKTRYCGGGAQKALTECASGTTTADLEGVRKTLSWVSAELKGINDLIVDAPADECGLHEENPGLGHFGQALAAIKHEGMWDQKKGRCSGEQVEKLACKQAMGFDDATYDASRDGTGETLGARFGSDGYEGQPNLQLNFSGVCKSTESFWTCPVWKDLKHFPHGLGFNIRNNSNASSNPAERMRQYDMPFLGGASGSVLDRILSAVAIAYELKGTVTWEMNLGGIAMFETIALVAGGHHSLGELLYGAHAAYLVLKKCEAANTTFFSSYGKALTAEHFEWCKAKLFSVSLASAGFAEAPIAALYEGMKNFKVGNPLTQAIEYNTAICAFIKKSAPGGQADGVCANYLLSLTGNVPHTWENCGNAYFTSSPLPPPPLPLSPSASWWD